MHSVEKYAYFLFIVFAFSPSQSFCDYTNTLSIKSSFDYQEAIILLTKNKLPEAALIIKDILKTNPYHILSLLNLAKTYTMLGRREEALQLLEQHIQKENNNDKREFLVRRINVLSRLFLTKNTLQNYQESLTSIKEKKYKQAIQQLQSILLLEPYHFEVLVSLGQCQLLEGRHDAAHETLRFAIKLNSYDTEIHSLLAKTFYERGEFKQALEELKHTKNNDIEAKNLLKLIQSK
ncbi:MAG: tetratricopeptide repeat protein [Bdellovibrio sp.]|nr:tetratricopeptide repeat protein [Bdellovibrio sp.]